MSILSKGAEATIYETQDGIKKVREPKSYRIEELDTYLRKKRTKSEAKILRKLYPLTPKVIEEDEYEIVMEKIDGEKVRDVIQDSPGIGEEIGNVMAEMHGKDISHGDPTTSNMIYADAIKLIDFGLATMNARVEDKAVDLHVFHSILRSTHADTKEQIWKEFLQGYTPQNKDDIMKRYEKVKQRGRYK